MAVHREFRGPHPLCPVVAIMQGEGVHGDQIPETGFPYGDQATFSGYSNKLALDRSSEVALLENGGPRFRCIQALATMLDGPLADLTDQIELPRVWVDGTKTGMSTDVVGDTHPAETVIVEHRLHGLAAGGLMCPADRTAAAQPRQPHL